MRIDAHAYDRSKPEDRVISPDLEKIEGSSRTDLHGPRTYTAFRSRACSRRVWRVRCEATSVFCFLFSNVSFDGRDLGPRNSYRWLLPEGLLCGPGPSNRVRDRGASDSYRRLLPEGLLCGSPPVEFTRGLTTSKFKCPRRLSLAQCRSERRKPPREVLGPHSTLPPPMSECSPPYGEAEVSDTD